MAQDQNRNDPYLDVDSKDDLRRRAQLDNELQADPELAEGTASGGRMGLYAIAVVAILGVVFYGMSTSRTPDTTSTADKGSPTSTTNPPAAPSASTPPAGQTTGSASPSSGNTMAPAAKPQDAAPSGAEAPRANGSEPTGSPPNR